MRSNQQHQFSKVARADIERSVFNRSFGHKSTFNAGELIPVMVDEALPGDTMTLRMHTFARLSTPIFPVMDNMFLDSFFFAVPVRLIWDNFQKFMGEQNTPGDSTDYLIPTMTSSASGGIDESSIHDYLGIPPTIESLTFNALHGRAYNLIWNEWFRDENLQDPAIVRMGDGPDNTSDQVIRRRGKRHDYFTSCLPWPQKGAAVSIPLADTAPVIPTTAGVPWFITDFTPYTIDINNAPAIEASSGTPGDGASAWQVTGLETDLQAAINPTINALRQAFQIQKLYERDARGGTRYTEIVRSHFNVVSSDQRLQRPEYLGGGTQTINFTPVPQTSGTDGTSPQGNTAAYATSSGSGHHFQKSFTEHCVIIGMVSVRADLNYQQGLPRMYSRQTRWDYYWPTLSHLGEMGVKNKEIYAQGAANPTEDEEIFGYQEAWSEYRYKPSTIAGRFRSSSNIPLDSWHLAQDFSTLPVLDDAFVQETPPVARIVAVPNEPDILFDSYFDFKCVRPMPTYSTPGMIDHF